MIELSRWSPPTDLGILPDVKATSSPNEPLFLGPDNNIPPLYELPLAFWYMNLLFNESHKNDAVPFAEPESYIFKPPNLSDGSLTFTEINDVSTFN